MCNYFVWDGTFSPILIAPGFISEFSESGTPFVSGALLQPASANNNSEVAKKLRTRFFIRKLSVVGGSERQPEITRCLDQESRCCQRWR